MAKAFIIITCGLITLVLCYFLIYPKYKEREIQSDFKTIAQQRLEDLKLDAAEIERNTKKCERKETTFFGQNEIYYGSHTDHIDEYSDEYFIAVRKTDSLTSPYVAIARYPYVSKFYYSDRGSSEKDCLELKLPRHIKNEERVLTFAYQNDKWVQTTK